jgi:hypothetical protein
MVWRKDQMPIYFCAWHVLKVWHLHLMEKIKHNGVHHVTFDNLHSSCTCPLNWVKAFKPSQTMREIKSLKAWPNICLVIHALSTFGPIIFSFVCDLTFNPLLLFHHVVCIAKYPFQWSKQSHVGIMYLVIDLWMVTLWQVPHSNQDT